MKISYTVIMNITQQVTADVISKPWFKSYNSNDNYKIVNCSISAYEGNNQMYYLLFFEPKWKILLLDSNNAICTHYTQVYVYF